VLAGVEPSTVKHSSKSEVSRNEDGEGAWRRKTSSGCRIIVLFAQAYGFCRARTYSQTVHRRTFKLITRVGVSYTHARHDCLYCVNTSQAAEFRGEAQSDVKLGCEEGLRIARLDLQLSSL